MYSNDKMIDRYYQNQNIITSFLLLLTVHYISDANLYLNKNSW